MIFTLKPRLVRTDKEWEILRLIRNSCRESFSHDQREITPEMQKAYRAALVRNERTVLHYLYFDQDVAVGFSRMYQNSSSQITVTFGVALWARGCHYEHQIVPMMMLAAGGPMIADVLLTNEGSRLINNHYGFIETRKDHCLSYIECEWPPMQLIRRLGGQHGKAEDHPTIQGGDEQTGK